MAKKAKKVGVVGAGVSGLTCAIRAAEKGNRVTVLASEEGSRTTSSIAAAFHYPFWTGQKPDHSWYEPDWAERTLREFELLAAEPEAGITKVNLLEYFSEEMTDPEIREVIDAMWWRLLPEIGFRELHPDELEQKHLRRVRFKGGITFQTFVVNMSDYLGYLKRRCLELGVTFESGTVNNLSDLSPRFDTIINCSGIGARSLVADDVEEGKHRLSPVEGVVLRLSPLAGVRDISLIHTGNYFDSNPVYIVPRGGANPDTIIGGTVTPESTLAERERKACTPQHIPFADLPEDHWSRPYVERILADCFAFEPTLGEAEIMEVKIGYRPRRSPKVRLEKCGNVIHNYGHAGGGLTLSWGCADEVVSMI
jgi:D-amino-acid oxidase